MPKNDQFWRVFENLAGNQFYQTGHYQKGQKIGENANIQKFKCDILSNFQTM